MELMYTERCHENKKDEVNVEVGVSSLAYRHTCREILTTVA